MLGLGVAGVRVRVWGQFRTGSTEPRFDTKRGFFEGS